MENIIIFAACIGIAVYSIKQVEKYFLYMSTRVFYIYLAITCIAILFGAQALVRFITQ